MDAGSVAGFGKSGGEAGIDTTSLAASVSGARQNAAACKTLVKRILVCRGCVCYVCLVILSCNKHDVDMNAVVGPSFSYILVTLSRFCRLLRRTTSATIPSFNHIDEDKVIFGYTIFGIVRAI